LNNFDVLGLGLGFNRTTGFWSLFFLGDLRQIWKKIIFVFLIVLDPGNMFPIRRVKSEELGEKKPKSINLSKFGLFFEGSNFKIS